MKADVLSCSEKLNITSFNFYHQLRQSFNSIHTAYQTLSNSDSATLWIQTSIWKQEQGHPVLPVASQLEEILP